MAWWTDARYGDAVLAIMNKALTQAIQQLQNHPLKNALASGGATHTGAQREFHSALAACARATGGLPAFG
jgi:hypothetical protein